MDMRLKTAKYTVGGKEYEMCCNMNVLADVQETVDGDMLGLFNSTATYKTALIFGAAMLNEYADAQGWPERFTAKSLGRQIEELPADFSTFVTGLVMSAIFRSDEQQDAKPDEGGDDAPKN